MATFRESSAAARLQPVPPAPSDAEFSDTQTVLEYHTFSELRFGVPNPDFGVAGLSGNVGGQQFVAPRQFRVGARFEF